MWWWWWGNEDKDEGTGDTEGSDWKEWRERKLLRSVMYERRIKVTKIKGKRKRTNNSK